MELQTSRFGKLQVEEGEIISFPKGIPGFEDHTGFLIVATEQDEPFVYLQSVQDGDLAFILSDPFLFYPGYEFELPDAAAAELGVESPEQLSVRCIISLQGDLDKSTINLVAPVIINVEARLGKQVVLGQSPYTTRHPLLAAAIR